MSERKESEAEACSCPYCDAEIVVEEAIFCTGCKTVIIECASCGQPVRKDADSCPNCGEKPA